MERTQVSLKARVANLLEVSSTIVPVIVLVLGIGMMRFMPLAPSTPIFSSHEEAAAFLKDYNMLVRPDMPLLISSNNCNECAPFRQSLLNEKIPFVEQNADIHPGAAALLLRIRKFTTDPSLPRVLVGRKVVPTNVAAVKIALKRVSAGKE